MKRFLALFAFLLLGTACFAQQTITIGFTFSNTGALNVDSLEQYRGFELWRDQSTPPAASKPAERATRSSSSTTMTNPTPSACSSFTRA